MTKVHWRLVDDVGQRAEGWVPVTEVTAEGIRRQVGEEFGVRVCRDLFPDAKQIITLWANGYKVTL